jgi:hypothetical protein
LLLVAVSSHLGFEQRGIVSLVDFISREVCGINGRSQTWLEWCTDTAQVLELDATEKRMCLDLMGTAAAETVFGVANETVDYLVSKTAFIK